MVWFESYMVIFISIRTTTGVYDVYNVRWSLKIVEKLSSDNQTDCYLSSFHSLDIFWRTKSGQTDFQWWWFFKKKFEITKNISFRLIPISKKKYKIFSSSVSIILCPKWPDQSEFDLPCKSGYCL